MPGKYGPHGELSFFLIQKELATVPVGETFSPFFNADICTTFFSADVLKKCALTALHFIAGGEDGCHASGQGDKRKVGCPKSPMWESQGEALSEDETASSSGTREGNVYNDALHVSRLYWLGDKISLSLQDWELAKVAWSCHMALDMLCQGLKGRW